MFHLTLSKEPYVCSLVANSLFKINFNSLLTFILIKNPVDLTSSFQFEFLKSLALGWRRGSTLWGRLSRGRQKPILSITAGLSISLPGTAPGGGLCTVPFFPLSTAFHLSCTHQGGHVWFDAGMSNSHPEPLTVHFTDQPTLFTLDSAQFTTCGCKWYTLVSVCFIIIVILRVNNIEETETYNLTS